VWQKAGGKMKIIRLVELGSSEPYIFNIGDEDMVSGSTVESIDPIFYVKTIRVYNSYGDDCFKVNFTDGTMMQVPRARFTAIWAPDSEVKE
jgi:hypothetical protein